MFNKTKTQTIKKYIYDINIKNIIDNKKCVFQNKKKKYIKPNETRPTQSVEQNINTNFIKKYNL